MKDTFYTVRTPVRIALVTDTHGCPFRPIADSLERNRPDLIAVAGDIIMSDRPENGGLVVDEQKNILPLLRACAGIAPTFLSVGNHEWLLCGEDWDRIRDTGVTLLDDSWTTWNGMVVGGQTSGWVLKYRAFRTGKAERYPRYGHRIQGPPDTGWLSDFEKQEGFKLLLCHHPEYYPEYLAGRDIDLILSGHAHGGQWRFFGRGVYAPGQGLWPKLTAGVHDGRLVISRGLANTAGFPRINNPMEIVYLLPEG